MELKTCNIAQGLLDEGRINTFIELVQDGVLTVADAAKRAGLSVEEFEKKMEEYKA